jgi:nitrite reductase/ring-hydroxylating ferredoxin subunit
MSDAAHWRTLPGAPAAGTPLCRVEEIPDDGAREVRFGDGKDAFGVLLLRRGDVVHAYRNCCPHHSLPLNFEPGLFHLFDGELLMCAHHTAMFRIVDGYCYDGPCLGASLQRVPLVREDGLLKVGGD